jgi:hypothetical protein
VQIVEQEGDYALALKANQESLYDDVALLLNDPEASQITMLPVVSRSWTDRNAHNNCFDLGAVAQ